MIKDAKEVISTARKEHPNKKILLYGHSLGTGLRNVVKIRSVSL